MIVALAPHHALRSRIAVGKSADFLQQVANRLTFLHRCVAVRGPNNLLQTHVILWMTGEQTVIRLVLTGHLLAIGFAVLEDREHFKDGIRVVASARHVDRASMVGLQLKLAPMAGNAFVAIGIDGVQNIVGLR